MTNRYPPINPKCPHFLHGGDYNPEQWIATPEVWQEDMRLMKLAGCNAMSVGIFAWVAMEPQEGRFTFEWLDRIMDMLAANKAFAVLATPSGARPAWMSAKYPEVLKVDANRQRILHGQRHNTCPTSPAYREKCQIINRKLAERYKDHPALLVWHVSNEYNGISCHCELCQDAFRGYLKEKYKTLDALNGAWWTGFWSHTLTDWSQIESPSPRGETCVHGLELDWRRFTTHQVIEFYKAESAPLREVTPAVPVTTNFMGTYEGLDYWEFAKSVDVVSWDNYPDWHSKLGDVAVAQDIAFVHDIYRCMKGGRPFMLMESTPSVTNWRQCSRLKKPGMHRLSSLQAVAHGSDTVQYFQWRKSRGSCEKFHGAVVDHVGHENTRVFADVAELGAALKTLDGVVGSTVRPEVGLIYDWQTKWAIDISQGPRNINKDYEPTCQNFYRPLWQMALPTDVIDQTCDFSSYKLLIAPMLYMLRPGVAKRIEQFVREGGTLVTTYLCGIADENDLVFLGGLPGGGLREVLGVWAEETDALCEGDTNTVLPIKNNALGLAKPYQATQYCDLIHLEGATALAAYATDFYAGRPAVTVNSYGKGKAYYIASRNEQSFQRDLLTALASELSLKRVISQELPEGVTAQMRTAGKHEYVFLMNFNDESKMVDVGPQTCTDLITETHLSGAVSIGAYGSMVLKRDK